MKRALVVLVLLLSSHVAAAKPMMIHTVWSTCSEARSWEPLKKCLERFGDVSVERTLDRVKVVRVGENAQGDGPGFYLYAERAGGLQLVGLWQVPAGSKLELLAIDTISVGKRSGYLLDLGSVEPTAISLEPETQVEATMQRRTAAFCMDGSWYCTAAVQSCDVLVGGKAYFTFRGDMKRTGRVVAIAGDRSRAGACAPPEQIEVVQP